MDYISHTDDYVWKQGFEGILSHMPAPERDFTIRLHDSSFLFHTFSDPTRDQMFWQFYYPKTAVLYRATFFSDQPQVNGITPHIIHVIGVEVDLSLTSFRDWEMLRQLPDLELIRIYHPLYSQYLRDFPDAYFDLGLRHKLNSRSNPIRPEPMGTPMTLNSIYLNYAPWGKTRDLVDRVIWYLHLPSDRQPFIAQFTFDNDKVNIYKI